MSRQPRAQARAATVEDFKFMSSIIGTPATIFRIARTRGVSVETVCRYLKASGISYHLDSREVPA